MALLKKKTQTGQPSAPKKQIIKVNPYENPENVMELMANICSAQASADTNLYWNTINEAYNKEVRGKSLNDYLKENRGRLLNGDFEHDLKNFCQELSWSLTSRENTEHTKIVVAGGFSSGKSTFLNRLTDRTNLLPTGTDPVSVVKTYLYCSRNTGVISVRGVNQKNVLVDLKPGVLQAIQHANKSNVYLASVLDKLLVEIPSNELDGLVFIDTPGYNNTDKANQSNGKTDKETALEALKEGNVLFWFVGGTTITTDDVDIIRQFNGPKVIFFSKAEKHGGFAESKKIVEDAAGILYKKFDRNEIIDVLAYSSSEKKIYYSLNGMNLSTIVQESKRMGGNGVSEICSWKELIGMLFDDEITASQNEIKRIEENYKEKLERKNKNQENYRSAKEYQDMIVGELRELLITNYNMVLNACNEYCDSSCNACNTMGEFVNAVYEWDRTDHECWDNTLTPILQKYNNRHDNLCKVHNAIDYTWYKHEYRQDVLNRVNEEENFAVSCIKDWYDDACRDCENALEGKTREQQIIKDMQDYRNIFMSALEMGIKQYQQQNKATSVHKDEKGEKEEKSTAPNVFGCIKKDNYKEFLHSFEDGVDLSVCNAEGFNPLTLAVYTGNNMMVQFMLDHDADPSIKDRRGYNAFHTAVENQYRDICKILLDLDPELIETKTESGESIEDLLRKQTFTKWIEQEIDNAI